MKIIKKIDETLTEVQVLIYAPNELAFSSLAEKIDERISFATVEGIIFFAKTRVIVYKSSK